MTPVVEQTNSNETFSLGIAPVEAENYLRMYGICYLLQLNFANNVEIQPD